MKRQIVFIIFIVLSGFAFSQTNEGQVHGNFQADVQYYNTDTMIGASAVPEKLLMNSYANINYTKGKFSAGARLESYLNTLQGFDARNNGLGIPYRYATFNSDELDVAVGNFYEQYGSGLLLRAYEDKGLGYDNAIDGIQVKYAPLKGIYLKGLIGKQRYYFDHGPGIVRGVDGEVNINELISFLAEKKTIVILGGSFVSKYQKDDDPIYILPENVAAGGGRLNVICGKFNVSGEYDYKINDPSSDNKYIYKPGEAILVNASFSQKGLGIYISAKRVDNMSFRSDRNANLNNLSINYIPAMTKNHVYSLAAMYPYASQPTGEVGGQAEVIYKIKKETKAGGKYGTTISVNFSRVNALKKYAPPDTSAIGVKGTLGYASNWYEADDDIYYQDFNFEINRKISKKFTVVLTYLNLIYNYDVIRGMAGHGKVFANVGIADVTFKIKPEHALRLEIQSLTTPHDNRDWAMGLLEYSIAPHWFFSVCDQYNYANKEKDKRVHYYSAAIGYTKNSHRIQLGYGRQREGVMCVGGVCRNVPAANGFTLAISSSF